MCREVTIEEGFTGAEDFLAPPPKRLPKGSRWNPNSTNAGKRANRLSTGSP
jgi:hypothetical protein